jgi:hypothetical protein
MLVVVMDEKSHIYIVSRPCFDRRIEKFGTVAFCLYLIIIVQLWINWAQKIRLVIYNQTVQLVIFYLHLLLHACV